VNFPLKAAFGNILLGPRGEAAALYRVQAVSYPFLSVRNKRDLLGRLAAFAYGVNAHFSLYRAQRSYPADEYVEQGMAVADPRTDLRQWDAYLRSHERRIRELRPFQPEVYIAVALDTGERTNVGASFIDRWDKARRKSGPGRVSKRTLQRLRDAEERAHSRTAGVLDARRATTRELQWLLRRSSVRGVAEPVIDQNWKPAVHVDPDGSFEPLAYTVERHANAPVTEHDRHLVVDGDEARSYQSMLTLGALPETSEFPGSSELLFTPLEGLRFPVDVVMHCRFIPNRQAVSKVRKRVVDADNAYRDETLSEHGSLSTVADENRSIARELDSYLRSTEHPPLLNVSVAFAVGGSTAEELDQRVEQLRARYGTVHLHKPLGLQPALFMDHLPRADCGVVRDYQDVLTKEQFAALMPIGTHQAGSDRGSYIAHTLSAGSRPVKFDVTEASQSGRPPSILLAGTPGSGKTITVQQFVAMAALRGSLVVDVDPKPDHNLEGLAELQEMVQVIELGGHDDYRGMLDPLVVAPESVREDLTASYLMDLIPECPRTWETQVRKAVRAVMVQDRGSCLRVLDWLNASADSDARSAGDALGVWADSGIGRLGFGDGTAHAPDTYRPVTTVKASALNLPDPGVARADYDQSERLSVATLKLLVAYAMRRITEDRSRHKVIAFDEAHFLLDSSAGRRLIDRLNRMGRSMNATLLLASQRLSDSGDLESIIGTRLIFGQETEQEAARALELLGLDPTDSALISRVRGYRKGRCLIRDIHDRVAEVQIDVVDPEWLRVLDTTPRAHVA
jgi:hypothetical protein